METAHLSSADDVRLPPLCDYHHRDGICLSNSRADTDHPADPVDPGRADDSRRWFLVFVLSQGKRRLLRRFAFASGACGPVRRLASRERPIRTDLAFFT